MTNNLVTKQQPHHEFIGPFLAQKCIYACHSRQFCRSLFIRIMFLYFGLFMGFFYIHVHIVKKVVIFRLQKRKSLPFTINHSSTEKIKSSQYQFLIFFFLSIFSVYNDLETHFLLSTKFRAMFFCIGSITRHCGLVITCALGHVTCIGQMRF